MTHFDGRMMALGSEASQPDWPEEPSVRYAAFLDEALDMKGAGEASGKAETDAAVEDI